MANLSSSVTSVTATTITVVVNSLPGIQVDYECNGIQVTKTANGNGVSSHTFTGLTPGTTYPVTIDSADGKGTTFPASTTGGGGEMEAHVHVLPEAGGSVVQTISMVPDGDGVTVTDSAG